MSGQLPAAGRSRNLDQLQQAQSRAFLVRAQTGVHHLDQLTAGARQGVNFSPESDNHFHAMALLLSPQAIHP